MMFDAPTKKLIAVVAGIVTLVATGLWWFDVLPWWGIVIAVPVFTLGVLGVMIVIGILSWMASGSH